MNPGTPYNFPLPDLTTLQLFDLLSMHGHQNIQNSNQIKLCFVVLYILGT